VGQKEGESGFKQGALLGKKKRGEKRLQFILSKSCLLSGGIREGATVKPQPVTGEGQAPRR